MSTTVSVTARPRSVGAVLLDRLGLVYPPAVTPVAVPDPVVAAGLVLLEADLLERGLLMSPALRQRLSGLDAATLGAHGTALLADIDATLGADRTMVPLLRGFPRSTPKDTLALYVDRVLTLLFQSPEQPCILCGTVGSVAAVSPCAHLVCRACFDGTNYSACPICHRHIDAGDPFLRPAPPRRRGRELHLPQRARIAFPGTDPVADARREIDRLLARSAALSPQDTDDLLVLLGVADREQLGWLPSPIPARETKALVLGWLLGQAVAWPVLGPALAEHLDTATDALRLLSVHSGGDAGLVRVPRFGRVPRPLRRTVLEALDRIDARTLVEDLHRYPRLWIHAAERLHPFEHAAAYPRAAAGFAVLRRTALTGDRLSGRLRETARGNGLHADGRLTSVTFGARVEAHLAARDVPAAVPELSARPGELLRRLDHLLRLADGTPHTGTVLEALPSAAAKVSPAVLLGALGAVRVRATEQPRRVFFPKGGSARPHIAPDTRVPLALSTVDTVARLLTTEALRRYARLEPVAQALIDERLDGLVAPFTQRTASRALVTLPRGSAVEVPAANTLRLFLHWTQSEVRVDLDLSVAFFDRYWKHIGTCDFTSLRWAGDAAVHSGDLTDAPPPLGATEFLDLDTAAIETAGARYAVAVVFSYNNVGFEDMAEAFAGVMVRADAPDAGPLFDVRTVEQRFDLTGSARACVPFVVDLGPRTLRWLDVAPGVTGTRHSVHRHRNALGLLGEALTDLYRSGARIGLGELARWQAAARAAVTVVRRADGSLVSYTRRGGEDVWAYAHRIGTPDADGTDAEPERTGLAFLYRGDVALAPGAQAYALHPGTLDATRVRLLAAADLTAMLAPRPA